MHRFVAVILAFISISTGAGEVAANMWTNLSNEGIGSRYSPGLVYAPSLKRLVMFGGQDDRPSSYDVLSSEVGSGTWRNEFPAGANWGPEFGVATPPAFKLPGDLVDSGGHCRLNPRKAKLHFQYTFAPDSNSVWALVCGHTLRLDLSSMTWQDLSDKSGPGANTGLFSPGFPAHLQWGSLVYDSLNKELVQFGGAHGAPQRDGAQTWVYSLAGKKWTKLDFQSKVLDETRKQADELRGRTKDLVAALRNRYYQAESAEKAKADLGQAAEALLNQAKALADRLAASVGGNDQEKRQVEWARAGLADALASLTGVKAAPAPLPAGIIKEAERAERALMRTRDSLEVQPPPRLLAPMVYDPSSKKIVLFGGDRWDHLCAETWLYDPQTRTWIEQRPQLSPAPRAGHALVYLPKQGHVLLLGGYSYGASGYAPGAAEMWTYDVPANRWHVVKACEPKQWPPLNEGWRGCGPAVAAAAPDDTVTAAGQVGMGKTSLWTCRIDTTGDEAATAKLGVKPGTTQRRGKCFDPSWFEDTAPLDNAAVTSKLAALPANSWVPMEPPKKFTTDRAWGRPVLDPDRDQVLHWSGGHSAYCGTDPIHYALAVNRWSIPYFAEMQMEYLFGAGQGGYAVGCPFSGRPFTPHTYLCYDYDAATKKMYFTDKSRLWAYDPDKREWLPDAPALPFSTNSGNTALCATPHGLVVWRSEAGSNPSLWLQQEPLTGTWQCLAEAGKNSLPVHYADSSGMTYDSKRGRMLMFHFGQKEKQKVWTYDFAGKTVSVLNPKTGGAFPETVGLARHAIYLPDDDVVFAPTPGPVPLTLIYDCVENAWLNMPNFADQDKAGRPIVPGGYGVSTGMMWDPKRKLLWAGDAYGNIFVMKFERKTAALTALDKIAPAISAK